MGFALPAVLAILLILTAPAAGQDLPDTIEVQRNLATQLLRSGNHRRAVEEFKKVLAKQPGDTEALRGISQALLKLDRSAEAIPYLEPLAADTARRELGDLLTLGNLYLKAGRKSDAARVAGAMGTSPGGAKPDDLLDLANLWLDVANAKVARAILNKLPKGTRESQRGRELDADTLSALGEHEKAAQAYLALAGPGRDKLDFAWRHAEELDLAGDKAKAFAEVKKLLPRGATTPQLVFAAQLALDQKDIDLAEKVVARIPDSVRTLDVELVRAEVKIARGDYLDAEVVLERAFKLYPDSARLRQTMAPVLLELGSFQRALTVLKPLLGRGAALADLKVASQIYRALGRTDDQEATYRRIVAAAPRDTDLALDLADFLVGELAGKHAITVLRALAPKGDARLTAMTIHGAALLTLHARDSAVLGAIDPLFRKASIPHDVSIRLADLMLDLGYPNKALIALRRAAGPGKPPARALVLQARAFFRKDANRDRALEAAMAAMARLGEGPPIQEIFELAEVLLELKAPELALKVVDFKRPPQIRQFAFDLLRARILYLALADVEHGEKLLRDLVRNKSPNLTLDLDLASLLLEVHEVDLAIRFLDSIAPTPEYLLRHGLLRAVASVRSREGRRAAQLLLAELEPRLAANPGEIVDFAEVLLEVPDRTRAMKLLMSLDPPRRFAFRHKHLLAQALLKVNDFAAVEDILGSLKDELRVGPDRKASAIELALGLKELRAAEVMFAQLPEWWLDSQEGRRLIVNMDIARGRFDHALEVSRRLVRDRPMDPNELNLQGQSHIGVKQYCEALAIFDDVLKLIPDKEEFILGRAQALRGLERERESLKPHLDLVARYDKLGEMPPIDFIVEAAEALDENKKRASAREFYERAIELRPDDPDYKKALAGTLSRLDEHQLAYSTFKDGAYRKPEPEDAVAAAGYLRELGSPERAKATYEEALRRDPEDLDAKRGLASVLAERDATRRRGIALYRQILNVKPDDHTTRALLASALAREKLYDDADFELEETHVKKPRDRETRRVRSTIDIVHGYPNIADATTVALKYQERSDPEAEIGLADVAAARGRGYLVDEVRHVLAAKTIAPRRRAVLRRQEQLFLPLFAFDTVRESGSDTLERDTDSFSLTRLLMPDKEGEALLERKAVRRRGIEVSGADLTGQVLWNFRPGATATGALTVGELGGAIDVLPKLELKYRDLHGVLVGADLVRLRIDDSPDALLAGLRSNTVRLIVGKELGPILTELTFRLDELSDGNERRSIVSILRYRPVPRFDVTLELQSRSSDRVPVPFDLYFAPLEYTFVQGGVELRTPRLSGYEFSLGGAVLADRLDEDTGNGFRLRARGERAMGPLAGAFLAFEYLETSATRRLGLPQAFDNTTFNAGYSSRF